MGTKLLLNRYLTFCFVISSLAAFAQDNCKEIKATIEVFQPGQKEEKGSVKIDFHGQSSSAFSITLFGPKGYLRKDIQELELKNLDQGKYVCVFDPKRKEVGFCIKHFEFTVK